MKYIAYTIIQLFLYTVAGVSGGGSAEFIADLSRAVRTNIGLPPEITEPPPEPLPKGRKARKEFLRQKKLQKQAPPNPNEIASSLVERHESRLTRVTAKHEKDMFGLWDSEVSVPIGRQAGPVTAVVDDDPGKGTHNKHNLREEFLNCIILTQNNTNSDPLYNAIFKFRG